MIAALIANTFGARCSSAATGGELASGGGCEEAMALSIFEDIQRLAARASS
jgi:hypothetical protein